MVRAATKVATLDFDVRVLPRRNSSLTQATAAQRRSQRTRDMDWAAPSPARLRNKEALGDGAAFAKTRKSRKWRPSDNKQKYDCSVKKQKISSVQETRENTGFPRRVRMVREQMEREDEPDGEARHQRGRGRRSHLRQDGRPPESTGGWTE